MVRSPARGDAAGRLSRRIGLLTVGAGAYLALLPFVHPADAVGMRSPAWVPVHLLYFAALAIILLALTALLLGRMAEAGPLDLAGFFGAFLGTAMLLMEGREHLFSPSFGQGELPGLWELIAGALIFSVGYILLGVAIMRAGELPRSAGLLLAIGGPIVAFSPPIGIVLVQIIGHALFGVGLARLGYARWSEGRAATTGPAA